MKVDNGLYVIIHDAVDRFVAGEVVPMGWVWIPGICGSIQGKWVLCKLGILYLNRALILTLMEYPYYWQRFKLCGNTVAQGEYMER